MNMRKRFKPSLFQKQLLFAEEQTILSRERTILSFMQVGLAFIGVGLIIINVFHNSSITLLGVVLVFIGILEVGESLRRLHVYKKSMEKIKRRKKTFVIKGRSV